MNQVVNPKPGAGDVPDRAAAQESLRATVSMGKWNFYFLVKFFLFWKGMISFHPLENLAFAAFLLLPVESAVWRKLKNVLAVLLGVALLYHDSWLPAVGRVYSQLSLLSHFDAAYLTELAGRFVNISLLATLFIAWVVYRLIDTWVRLGLVVIGGMLVIAVSQHMPEHAIAEAGQLPQQQAAATGTPESKPDLDKVLRDFYAREATRSVSFPVPSAQEVPFDVIFIHICSLSWDDISAVGLGQHPIWKHFDFLFKHFNSAASYSGPAAIRIERATCGQLPNKGLFQPVAGQCYLMGSLKRSGFEQSLALNHDGHFGGFLKEVQEQQLDIPPMPLEGVPVREHAFDGSPVYDDFSVLSRWLERRQKSDSPRVALYYNTISLHDGNRLIGANAGEDSMETYRKRLSLLLDGIDKFMTKLEQSGRRAVVVVIPEHGAAVRGDNMQIPGLREIPTPRITLVPVGIKVVGGGGQRQGDTLMINDETSYLAVSQVIANMLKNSPFDGNGYNPADYAANLPTTQFVSQNDTAVVMKYEGRYYWRRDGEEWSDYP